MAESLYDTLGVKKDASADAIRKAYRKLARKHHPDHNPNNKKSEEAFKRVASAYEVLADDKKRKAYDEFGDASLSAGFDADKAKEHARWQQQDPRQGQGPGPDFDFSDFFGRARGGGPRGPARASRGNDLYAKVQLELRQVIEGAEVGFELPGQGTVRVRIPSGADTGSTIRLAGRGAPGASGGPAGDLVIETEVAPHRWLERDNLDLLLRLPVDLDEAYNGGSVEVPTFDGSVMLKVPARSQSGTKLRLRGKGIRHKDKRGDMIVELDVRLPDTANEALAEAARAAKPAYTKPVRADITL